MILTGDKHQIDLKVCKMILLVHEVPKIDKVHKYVNEIILLDNHRHESLTEILKRLLNESY
jgi:hypothetical protein